MSEGIGPREVEGTAQGHTAPGGMGLEAGPGDAVSLPVAQPWRGLLRLRPLGAQPGRGV